MPEAGPESRFLLHWRRRLQQARRTFPGAGGDIRLRKDQEVLSETRLKIALFIDFDNIEIGVKTTLGGHFDVGAVLEAMKERGEVVTKVAYGDWTRAGDYSRSLTQHAIQMVQRNLTPGGDKNGADINLALDALEMAFTHSHINAFVIVGGDSDFMALVEKLKLYDRQVFVVGGRAFTSVILQKNCTEFIAYENLIGRRGSSSRGGASKDVKDAMPLVKRALKVLADREVMPQLGVLKSTLLQLDSTFSEREYGVSTFRDFVQKLERAQQVTLRGDERSLLVELRDGVEIPDHVATTPTPAPVAVQHHTPRAAAAAPPATPATASAVPPTEPVADGATAAVDPAVAGLQADGYATIRDIFLRPGVVSRWPLYVRQAKQVIRTANESFDERRHGFNGIVDALRYSQREGLFRLDRDRQGVIRIYPGPLLAEAGGDAVSAASQPEDAEQPVQPAMFDGASKVAAAPDVDDLHEPGDVNGNRAYPGEEPRGPRQSRRGRGGRGRGREGRPVIDVELEAGAPAQDGELFPTAAAPAVREEATPDMPVEPEPEAEPAPATPAPRKKAAARKAAAPRKKAAPAKKTARKTSR
jgi:uncharacterized LabA/DUF88 family protein